jgi:hypothetical protein
MIRDDCSQANQWQVEYIHEHITSFPDILLGLGAEGHCCKGMACQKDIMDCDISLLPNDTDQRLNVQTLMACLTGGEQHCSYIGYNKDHPKTWTHF